MGESLGMNNDEDDYDDDEDYSQEEWDNMSDDEQKIATLERKLYDLEQRHQVRETESQERKDKEYLDNTLKKLHTEHGDFSDQFVTALIANGVSPQDAIKAYQGEQQKIIDSQKNTPPPPALREAGGIPKDQVDKNKLNDPAYRKATGVAALEAARRAG